MLPILILLAIAFVKRKEIKRRLFRERRRQQRYKIHAIDNIENGTHLPKVKSKIQNRNAIWSLSDLKRQTKCCGASHSETTFTDFSGTYEINTK